MTGKPNYTYQELLDCGYGRLFGPGNPQLPIPNMLMFDRITTIDSANGHFEKGYAEAELDVHPELWFFECHFPGDPVMPGCLGLDALWQLLGFYLGWLGGTGKGRALGCGEVKFMGQILPHNALVRYCLDIKRVIARSRLTIGLADGHVIADDQIIYRAAELKVGLFHDPTKAM
ncbi:bifunctional 3-hydroxydecanoyl-ACP dehydratase/trans-2-decenoyl-ACP isomerase [Nitrococcus mobilis]|uniref:3-hydroxyacyl-[acyl-carrier-protein] dehydratase FabA n=1 Tax=Nitrococcus mobilis Nb-231 TaxID=314278 RepID=A4BRQ2_9GAMM|nr:bifunctional 3-hydroxydecanoyl-ACP dehydratase/trans-2-decenoyl-ACP isomerase [Nitrococcus mobilis]EAR21623.1 3-hydroxydecanoyl-ACP dehydratase [Nitrococcus mobilis Nb-231]